MNKVVHFEVPYDDKDRAMKFYSDVFDWQIQDMPEMDYVMAQTVKSDENFMPAEAGAINGGMYQRTEGGATGPVIVMDVASVDDHIQKVEAAGGSLVVPKVQVGEMGFYAQVRDTEGNIIGVWETIQS